MSDMFTQQKAEPQDAPGLGLPVNISSVPDMVYGYGSAAGVKFVDNPIVPDPQAIELLRSGQLDRLAGSGSSRKASILAQTRSTSAAGRARKSFWTDDCRMMLKEAILLEPVLHLVQTYGFLLATLGHYGQVMKILHQAVILLHGKKHSGFLPLGIDDELLLASSHLRSPFLRGRTERSLTAQEEYIETLPVATRGPLYSSTP